MKVVDYEKIDNSASYVTDRIKIEVSAEEADSLRKALKTMSDFEGTVASSFAQSRGYSASDSRHSDTFKEIHFWFKDGFVMASIRSGFVG